MLLVVCGILEIILGITMLAGPLAPIGLAAIILGVGFMTSGVMQELTR